MIDTLGEATADKRVSGPHGTSEPSSTAAALGLGDPNILGTELDGRDPENRGFLIPRAGVGSRLPSSCPRTQALGPWDFLSPNPAISRSNPYLSLFLTSPYPTLSFAETRSVLDLTSERDRFEIP